MTNEWQPIDTAPKDGTLVLLVIEQNEESMPLEDAARYSRTVGFNNLTNDGEDVWYMAGWCWEHDHFTEGHGKPVKWMLFPDMEEQHQDIEVPPFVDKRH